MHVARRIPERPDLRASKQRRWRSGGAGCDGRRAWDESCSLVRFQVLNRQPFDAKQFQQSGKIVFHVGSDAAGIERAAGVERYSQDNARYVTRVIAKFDLPTGTAVTPGQDFGMCGVATCWSMRITR